MSANNQKPVFTKQFGTIKVTVWANSVEGKDKPFYSTTITKSYYDEKETDESKKWKETDSLSRDDLPKAQELLRQAFSFICEQ